jgi:hypothetical protein
MMAIHELGHVLSTKINGGTIDYVELRPWLLSQTERHGSTHELVDVWAGPLFGSIAPVLIWLVLRSRSEILKFYTGFWAGFCLIINGLYLALGWWGGEANDSGELLKGGTPLAILIGLGLLMAASGLYGIHVLLERERSKT